MYENLDIQRTCNISVLRADTTDMLDTNIFRIGPMYMLDMRMVGVGTERINEVYIRKLQL
jgi:hypothetical protein